MQAAAKREKIYAEWRASRKPKDISAIADFCRKPQTLLDVGCFIGGEMTHMVLAPMIPQAEMEIEQRGAQRKARLRAALASLRFRFIYRRKGGRRRYLNFLYLFPLPSVPPPTEVMTRAALRFLGFEDDGLYWRKRHNRAVSAYRWLRRHFPHRRPHTSGEFGALEHPLPGGLFRFGIEDSASQLDSYVPRELRLESDGPIAEAAI